MAPLRNAALRARAFAFRSIVALIALVVALPRRALIAQTAHGTIPLLVLASLPATASAGLLLNEVLYDPAGADGGGEFVELIATGEAGVALDGVALEFCNGARPGAWESLWEGAAGDTVAARGLFVVGEANVPGADATATLGMQNGPESLRLRRGEAILDLLGYGAGLAPGHFEAAAAEDPSGLSLARRPDGVDTDQNALDWFAAEPSPGRLNFPAFRAVIVGAAPPWEPVAPGDDLAVSVTTANRGLAAWPAPLVLSLTGAADAWVDALPPGREAMASLRLPAPPAGELDLRIRAGLPGEPPADSLRMAARVGLGPLLLSEVLFAPLAGEPEWVECLPRASLSGLERFLLADFSGSGGEFAPPPSAQGEPFLLCADRGELLRARPGLSAARVLELSPWPSLANSGESEAFPGWTDGLRLDDAGGRRVDAMRYRGDWIGGRGESLERLAEFGAAGFSPWAATPQGPTPLAAADPAPPAPSGGPLALSPNPFDPARERQIFTLVGAGGQVTLRLFDAAGRPVQRLEGTLGSGRARLVWDGRDRAGRALGEGAYPFLVEWSAPDGSPRALKGVAGLRLAR